MIVPTTGQPGLEGRLELDQGIDRLIAAPGNANDSVINWSVAA